MKWKVVQHTNVDTTTLMNTSCYMGALHIVVYGATITSFAVNVTNRDEDGFHYFYARIFPAADREDVPIDVLAPVLMEGGMQVNTGGTGNAEVWVGYYEITAQQ